LGALEVRSYLQGSRFVVIDVAMPPCGTDIGVKRTRIRFGVWHGGALNNATSGLFVVLTADGREPIRVVIVKGIVRDQELPAWRFFTVALIVNIPSCELGVQIHEFAGEEARRSCIGPPGPATLKL
jgi:hypothetical protein